MEEKVFRVNFSLFLKADDVLDARQIWSRARQSTTYTLIEQNRFVGYSETCIHEVRGPGDHEPYCTYLQNLHMDRESLK